MPTQKPRINLTLDDEMNVLFDDLASLTGTPKARLIRELLVEMKPVLVDMRDGLSQAKHSRDNIPVVLARMASRANEKVALINSEMADFLKQSDWVSSND